MGVNVAPVVGEARAWLLPALLDGLSALADSALAVGPATLLLAQALLAGAHRDTLERLVYEARPALPDLQDVRLLVWQAVALAEKPPPQSAVAVDPPATRALDALAVELETRSDQRSGDSLVGELLGELLARAAASGDVAELFATALAITAPAPMICDAIALAHVGAACGLWRAQPPLYACSDE